MTIFAASIIRFDQPWWLLFAVAGVLPAAVAAVAVRHGRHIGRLGVALQTAAVVLVGAALARPMLRWGGSSRLPMLLLQDVSASTRGQDEPLKLPEAVAFERVDFAASLGDDQINDTQIAPALRLALSRSDGISGVIIHTDGQFLDEGWPQQAEALGRGGKEIIIVPMASAPPDARISDLSSLRRADGGIELRLTVTANATQQRTLRLWQDGDEDHPLMNRQLKLLVGESSTFCMSVMPPSDRATVYQAALSAGDDFPENDSAARIILPNRSRIAVVSAGQYPLEDLSVAIGLPVAAVSPEEAPASAAGWMDYAAVVLLDADGELLSPAQREAIAEYVRSGGGLVVIGAGPHKSAGDREDPLNRVSALLANPYERRPLEVIVVLDASGSMGETGGGAMKFDTASEAVISLRRHLTLQDGLAVITFADKPTKIYDSGPAQADFAELADAMRRVSPRGATKVEPALDLAANRIISDGRQGLVVLVSDLRTEDFDVASITHLFEQRKLSLAVVAIAAGKDASTQYPLESLAENLGSPLVHRTGLEDLAKIFAGFISEARGSDSRTGEFTATAGTDLFGRDTGKLPPLDEYIFCATQNGAEKLATVGGDVILARRKVGMGRSVSLAVPLTGSHNESWRNWPKLNNLLAGAVRWSEFAEADPRFVGEIIRRSGMIIVRVIAADATGPMNGLKLLATVDCIGGPASPRQLKFSQAAPGVYETTINLTDSDKTGLAITVSDAADGRILWRAAVPAMCLPEFMQTGADWNSLNRLAKLTGGRIVAANELVKTPLQLEHKSYSPVWQYMMVLATMIMLLEWSLTRLLRRGK